MYESDTLLEITSPAEPTPSPRLAVCSFGLTDPGRVRPSNEDQFLVAELTKAMRVQHTSLPQPKMQYADEQGHLFIVADGMGGHQAGEQVSALAVQSIEAFALNTLRWFFRLKRTEEQDVLNEFQVATPSRPTVFRIRSNVTGPNFVTRTNSLEHGRCRIPPESFLRAAYHWITEPGQEVVRS